jgi:hypothetical protein
MKTVDLTCDTCQTVFPRAKKEVDRNKKVGRKTYCSRKCSARNSINNIPEDKRRNTDHLKAFSRRDEYSDFRYFLRKARSRDSFNGRETDITLEFLKDLWGKQAGKCAYTGVSLSLALKKKRPYSASLDRVDSSRGYTKDNVQFVCYFINTGKSDFSDSDTKEFVQLVKMH